VLSVDRRSTGQRSFFWPLQPPVDRLGRPIISREQISLDRSTASRPDAWIWTVGRLGGRLDNSREQSSLGRSTDPVDRPLCWQRAQGCAHRSTGPVDRFGLSASLQVRKMDLKSFYKILKIHRNSTKIVLPIYLKEQTCLHKIKTCYDVLVYFCNLEIFAQEPKSIFPKHVFPNLFF